MTKTITITDPMQVKVGDKAYFKDCDFGFTVTRVDADNKYNPFSVYNPLLGGYYWIPSPRFDHATREVKLPEWPDPNDTKLHIYLGADGKKYLYLPTSKCDEMSWHLLPYCENSGWHSAKEMTSRYSASLPLKELKLVPKEEEA